MNRYELKVGRHIEDGKLYKKGDVITTAAPLTKMFKGKFIELGKAPAKSKRDPAETPENDAPPTTPPVAEKKAAKKRAAKKKAVPTPAPEDPPTEDEDGGDDWGD